MIANVAIIDKIPFLLIINNNAKKNNATNVECPLGKLKPSCTSGNGLTRWTEYLIANNKNPPTPALKNINTAFLTSLIHTKNTDNSIIINNKSLSLNISEIILAVCSNTFISIKSAIITSKIFLG